MARVDFNVNRLASRINYNAEAFVRKVILDGLINLIRQSPVDTGRFKANWSTSVGIINPEITESTTTNIQERSRGIVRYRLGQTMFLHNNLQYAIPLEYGSSEQAPRGWIRNTGIVMQRKLDEIKDLI
jgi:hypothetical protein